MRILLVNPRQSATLHTLTAAGDVLGCRACMPNLALATLAALVGPDDEVTLADESVEPIDYDTPWDLVGITGYVTQRTRMIAIADEFRRRGRLVVIGGPYATLSSRVVRPHADVLVLGEAEDTWPTFLADLRSGHWCPEYRATAPVALDASPLPAIGGQRNAAYYMGVVQTSRGCPFECEFCDVIVYLGRRQRHKAPERVVAELEQLHRVGYRNVFLADDNLTANRRRAAEIMAAIAAWQATQRERLFLVTQLSIDVARDGALLALCAEAGLRQAFIGIETPDPASLRNVKKRQNVRPDLVADVHAFHRAGIAVQAGMISGFDTDTTACFALQYNFVQRAGIPIVSAGILNAPEGTPLERRLAAEGRLSTELVDDFYLNTNVVPKLMTSAELADGMRWLLNRLYAPVAFLERLGVLAANLPAQPRATAGAVERAELWHRLVHAVGELGPDFRRVPLEAVRRFRGKDLSILAISLVYYLHVVRTLRVWDIWDEGLAARPAPFDDDAGDRTFTGTIGAMP